MHLHQKQRPPLLGTRNVSLSASNGAPVGARTGQSGPKQRKMTLLGESPGRCRIFSIARMTGLCVPTLPRKHLCQAGRAVPKGVNLALIRLTTNLGKDLKTCGSMNLVARRAMSCCWVDNDGR